jgi:hypothetical protein
MRRIISVALAFALTFGGIYFLILQLATVFDGGGFRGDLIGGAALMITLGAYWIYEDLISDRKARRSR